MGDGNMTIGSDFIRKNIEIDGKNYLCTIWDNGGNQNFRPIGKGMIVDSDIIVLVYDITNKKSFLELQFWIDTVVEKLGKENYLILVGNKSDLIDKEQVNEETGKKFAELIKAKFILTSAKENYAQFNDLLKYAIKDYIINYKKK